MRFKILDTEIYVSFLFVAVIAFLLCVDRTGLVIPTLLAVLIHELGHLFAMWMTDCTPKAIRLVPASVQIVRSFSVSKRNEWLITLAGPTANLLPALVLGINSRFYPNQTVLQFAILNLIIGLFNLLPVQGLDGGTVVRLIALRHTSPERAERVGRTVTLITAFVTLSGAIFLSIVGRFNLSAFIVATYFLTVAIAKR